MQRKQNQDSVLNFFYELTNKVLIANAVWLDITQSLLLILFVFAEVPIKEINL